MQIKKTKWSICGWVFPALVSCFGLAACGGGGEQPAQQQIEADWIHHEDTPAESTPAPVPTEPADAGPSPTPSPEVTPTPDPSASPTPIPSVSPSPTPTPTGTPLYTGPSSVEPYVVKFVADAMIQGVNVLPEMQDPKLEIRIANLDSYGASVIGLCETGNGRRRVTFDPDFWNRVSETQRELLAHHELGHCVLYRGHRTATLSTGAYVSIMYPIIMSSSTYLNDHNYYLEELFSQSAMEMESFSAGSNTHVCGQ